MEMKDSLHSNMLNDSSSDFWTSIVQRKMGKKTIIILAVIFLVALILLIVGITLISKASKPCEGGVASAKAAKRTSKACQYSSEAQRIGLQTFLRKVQSTYYKLHPENVAWHPDATTDKVRKEYAAYDPSPKAIKKRTDEAMALLKEANNMNENGDLMKPREYKALLQVRHYLRYVFDTPFDGNYYSGAWMLGPNTLCWVPMCSLGSDIYNNIGNMRPRSIKDIEAVLNHFRAINTTINQYIENMRTGIITGMVRTRKECKAGLDAIRKTFHNVSEQGSKGVLNEWYTAVFVKDQFYSLLSDAIKAEWHKQHGKSVNQSIKEVLVDYVGKSAEALLTYLEKDHYRHCRPNDQWAGGLSAMPIDYIYTDGIANKSQKTTKTLPLRDSDGKFPMLNGSYAYGLIMGYFTTTDMSPDKIYDMGQKRLQYLYSQALEIAGNVTGQTNQSLAVAEFQKKLRNLSSYFNDKEIPKNESEGDAFKLCNTIQKAKQNCPNRWKAMETWFAFARKVMAKLDPKTVDMFYFTGEKHTTPNCPIDLKPDFNPTTAAQSYSGSDTACSTKSIYNIPFFLKNMGPKYSEYSVNAHEARPGHHTQVQGNTEHFKDKCGGVIKWLDDQTYYTAFTEGWALYAENPLIAMNTDTYKDNLMQKYGMLKWQIWRALRLIVDTGMHAKGMSRATAAKYFADFAWDKTDLADKEITRYQSNPGQALGYMIGQLKIIDLRKYCEKELGKLFSMKEFHFQTLSQGSSPLSFLEGHIKKYVACKKSPTRAECIDILNPTKTSSESFIAGRQSDLILLKPPRPHYI